MRIHLALPIEWNNVSDLYVVFARNVRDKDKMPDGSSIVDLHTLRVSGSE